MKGIVFTEFFEMIEKKFGYEMVDTIINKSSLESNGVYTSVGTYNHSEIVQLLTNLSAETKTDPELLLKEFGRYIFDTFLSSYPQFFDKADNTFDFLASIDNHIHIEVKKLYPDATLPRFESHVDESGTMTMIYSSERSMSSLAHGLIERTIEHYGEELLVSKEPLTEDGTKVKFIISPK
jgi:hypothetical protein